MTLSVTNTLTGEREEFEPRGDEVLLYVCGLTVSDHAHLGHARLWVHADIMHRWLEYQGYTVRHVENFTDVNEKIVARIGEDELGETEATVADHFTNSVIQDMRGLNLKRATVYPRVSEHIPTIIDLVESLLDDGYAYEANGSVYFDVTAFDGYGDLSNQQLDEMEAQTPADERAEKRHPADFALWKAGGVKPDDLNEHRSEELDQLETTHGQTWNAPWGEGRPGWHIECSAMSMDHLDETLDIHVGGRDLMFPHHENEVAQSEAATDQQFARYWLHVGLLQSAGDKMSSSIGNILTIKQALDEHGVNVIRMFYLATAYRSEQTLGQSELAEATERWDRLNRAYEMAVDASNSTDAYAIVEDESLRSSVSETKSSFTSAMNNDFNVREAIASLLKLATSVNRHLDSQERYDYHGLYMAIEAFEVLGGEVCGLKFDDQPTGDGTVEIAEELIELILDVRETEREAGNYDRADELRDSLDEIGIEVQDNNEETIYRVNNQ
jgi:cysteinyl-tRNA synthetase